MKIEVSMLTKEGYRPVLVTAFSPFDMFGHSFFAHKGFSVLPDGKKLFTIKDWRVSEFHSGASVVKGHGTRAEAIAAAKEVLTRNGEEVFRQKMAQVMCEKEGYGDNNNRC